MLEQIDAITTSGMAALEILEKKKTTEDSKAPAAPTMGERRPWWRISVKRNHV